MPGALIYVPDPHHLQPLSIRIYNIPPLFSSHVIGAAQACRQDQPHTQSHRGRREGEIEEVEGRQKQKGGGGEVEHERLDVEGDRKVASRDGGGWIGRKERQRELNEKRKRRWRAAC